MGGEVASLCDRSDSVARTARPAVLGKDSHYKERILKWEGLAGNPGIQKFNIPILYEQLKKNQEYEIKIIF